MKQPKAGTSDIDPNGKCSRRFIECFLSGSVSLSGKCSFRERMLSLNWAFDVKGIICAALAV